MSSKIEGIIPNNPLFTKLKENIHSLIRLIQEKSGLTDEEGQDLVRTAFKASFPTQQQRIRQPIINIVNDSLLKSETDFNKQAGFLGTVAKLKVK